MIINKPHLVTKLQVWAPRYNDKYKNEYGEYVALLHKNKVDFATECIIVEFPKSKHLEGQRFAINKIKAQSHKVGTNGAAPMYEIPMSHFESWQSGKEVTEEIESLGW